MMHESRYHDPDFIRGIMLRSGTEYSECIARSTHAEKFVPVLFCGTSVTLNYIGLV